MDIGLAQNLASGLGRAELPGADATVATDQAAR
jgi:hypothetical protein